MRRIPSLDGLRAISISMVVLAHSGLSRANAFLGVTIFFVISGFLITTLLVQEREETGTISLRGFYFRRFTRIFPAYYAALLTLLLLSRFSALALKMPCWFASVAFVRNYATPVEHSADWFTAHFWSLSVEEQFYLFWPPLLTLVGRRKGAWISLALILVAPLLRLGTYFALPTMRNELGYFTHTRVDALMFGCFVAVVRDSSMLRRALDLAYRWFLPTAAVLFLGVVSPYLGGRFGAVYALPVGWSLDLAAITLVLLWAVEHPKSLAGRALNAKPVAHLGVISYSLYLWQQLLTPYHPWGALAAIVVAECSYYGLERPVLRWRARFEAQRQSRLLGQPQQLAS